MSDQELSTKQGLKGSNDEYIRQCEMIRKKIFDDLEPAMKPVRAYVEECRKQKEKIRQGEEKGQSGSEK